MKVMLARQIDRAAQLERIGADGTVYAQREMASMENKRKRTLLDLADWLLGKGRNDMLGRRRIS